MTTLDAIAATDAETLGLISQHRLRLIASHPAYVVAELPDGRQRKAYWHDYADGAACIAAAVKKAVESGHAD